MLRKNLAELDDDGQKGDWAFPNGYRYIAIRYSSDSLLGMVILPIAPEPGGWAWNGNRDAPTLTPSILVKDVPGWNIGWHGFLTDGKVVDA